ncbi:MAG: Na(+)-translocating NADH-quinone reductase subunit C [Myxococcota bacterium]
MPAPKEFTTKYVAVFAIAVCFVCAIFVASIAVGLKSKQEHNARVDRLSKVLSVAGLVAEGEVLTQQEVIDRFEENVEARAVDLQTGSYDESIDVATYDQRARAKDEATSRVAPANDAKVRRLPNRALVYLVKDGDSIRRVILPIEGYGLWSTLYGFLALDRDLRTIRGITFYEHGETPGLGGEVENPRWQAGWEGRLAFNDEGEVALEVVKGTAGSVDADPYSVDGLSGATITSRGVTYLIQFWLGDDGFGPYLDSIRDELAAADFSTPTRFAQTTQEPN